LFAIGYLYYVFNGGGLVGVETASTPKPVIEQTIAVKPQSIAQKTVESVKINNDKPPPLEERTQQQLNTYKGFLDVYFIKYHPRLAAFMYAKATTDKPERFYADIEFYDENDHLKNSFNLKQLREMGYTFRRSELGLVVKGGGGEYVVKDWKLQGCDGKECGRVGRRDDSSHDYDKFSEV
jgi:hypothetical protein